MTASFWWWNSARREISTWNWQFKSVSGSHILKKALTEVANKQKGDFSSKYFNLIYFKYLKCTLQSLRTCHISESLEEPL